MLEHRHVSKMLSGFGVLVPLCESRAQPRGRCGTSEVRLLADFFFRVFFIKFGSVVNYCVRKVFLKVKILECGHVISSNGLVLTS